MSIFLDESQLLLQHAGVDADLAAELLGNYGHEQWAEPALECQIQAFLDRKYLEVKQVTEEIYNQITEFGEELSNLEGSTETSSRGKVSTGPLQASCLSAEVGNSILGPALTLPSRPLPLLGEPAMPLGSLSNIRPLRPVSSHSPSRSTNLGDSEKQQRSFRNPEGSA